MSTTIYTILDHGEDYDDTARIALVTLSLEKAKQFAIDDDHWYIQVWEDDVRVGEYNREYDQSTLPDGQIGFSLSDRWGDFERYQS